ncbi:MAG TPA: MFS transporter, partial [Candidatus Saccharimonadales bacterium]
SLVDHHKKKIMMQISSLASLALYAIGCAIYLLAPGEAFKDVASPVLWTLVTVLLAGVLVGNIRTIALPTLVTILIPEDRRDKANGLVGSATGAAFLIVSVISGLMMGLWGITSIFILAISLTLVTLAHLWFIPVPEKGIVHTEDGGVRKTDIKGTVAAILAVPGLAALILFTTFNNFLGGAYMALMDAYGLSLMSVETWGFLWAVVSLGFIFGGLAIAKFGLGKNPLRTMFIANIVLWIISCLFTIQSSIWLLAIGMFLYMCIGPLVEASEQTIIQKVVPQKRQGRVFGFAQSVEMAASPLTAFLIGPITQFVFIPFMTTGAGVDWIGGWYGVGPDRGIALVFTLVGLIGLLVTLIAMGTKYYRLLSAQYTKA